MELTATQKKIIRILLAEKHSTRSLLAYELSLTNAALTLALKALISEGMVVEKRNDNGQKVGRKELSLALNPEYGSFLSVDIKKRHSYFYEMDFSGKIKEKKDDRDISFPAFLLSRKNRILGVGIVLRGEASKEKAKSRHLETIELLERQNIPYFIFNNVDCLADIHFLFSHKDKNFLLMKYGPGVGSSIYVNGKPLGSSSELGHTFYKNKTIEDSISYLSILNEDMEEKEATEIIRNDRRKLNKVLEALSFALVNADALLSFQKIILSGALLSSEDVVDSLKKHILSLKPDFDLNKISDYPNYIEINEIKGALGAFDKTFR